MEVGPPAGEFSPGRRPCLSGEKTPSCAKSRACMAQSGRRTGGVSWAAGAGGLLGPPVSVPASAASRNVAQARVSERGLQGLGRTGPV